ncbi:MAG: isochorismatase family protein [Pseudomonadota bacterium]
MFKSHNPALLIIDVQNAIDHFSKYERNNLHAESQIALLINQWRVSGLPIIHIRHSSKSLASPYHASSPAYMFKPEVMPLDSEVIITKQENCAFIGTKLEPTLKKLHITEIVVCGVLVNNSVDATIRVASGLGFSIFLPHDATAAFGMHTLNGKQFSANDVHWVFVSNLNGEYCEVVSTDELLSDC